MKIDYRSTGIIEPRSEPVVLLEILSKSGKKQPLPAWGV